MYSAILRFSNGLPGLVLERNCDGIGTRSGRHHCIYGAMYPDTLETSRGTLEVTVTPGSTQSCKGSSGAKLLVATTFSSCRSTCVVARRIPGQFRQHLRRTQLGAPTLSNIRSSNISGTITNFVGILRTLTNETGGDRAAVLWLRYLLAFTTPHSFLQQDSHGAPLPKLLSANTTSELQW